MKRKKPYKIVKTELFKEQEKKLPKKVKKELESVIKEIESNERITNRSNSGKREETPVFVVVQPFYYNPTSVGFFIYNKKPQTFK